MCITSNKLMEWITRFVRRQQKFYSLAKALRRELVPLLVIRYLPWPRIEVCCNMHSKTHDKYGISKIIYLRGYAYPTWRTWANFVMKYHRNKVRYEVCVKKLLNNFKCSFIWDDKKFCCYIYPFKDILVEWPNTKRDFTMRMLGKRV